MKFIRNNSNAFARILPSTTVNGTSNISLLGLITCEWPECLAPLGLDDAIAEDSPRGSAVCWVFSKWSFFQLVISARKNSCRSSSKLPLLS